MPPRGRLNLQYIDQPLDRFIFLARRSDSGYGARFGADIAHPEEVILAGLREHIPGRNCSAS